MSDHWWSFVCRDPEHYMRLPGWLPRWFATIITRIWERWHRHHNTTERPLHDGEDYVG